MSAFLLKRLYWSPFGMPIRRLRGTAPPPMTVYQEKTRMDVRMRRDAKRPPYHTFLLRPR